MREVIIGILSTEEMEAQTKFSETENVYKAEFPSMYQNMGELVRCKECIYYDGYGCCDLLSYLSRGEGVDYLRVNENEDFCSKAERKEE